jgi:competence protein ComEC
MDEIQRKLTRIDKELAGGKDFYDRLLTSSPLVFVALGLIAGILIQNALQLPPALWLLFLILCFAAAISFFAVQSKNGFASITLTLLSSCALICFTCLGAIRLAAYYKPKAGDIRNMVADERILATVRGRILTAPYINENKDWEFGRFQHSDPACSFYLEAAEVKTVEGWAKVTGTIRVYVNEPVMDLKIGDYIQAYCWLDTFKRPANPGQFDMAKYLARKNVFVGASVKSRDGIELLQPNVPRIFTEIKRKIKETASQILLDNMSPEDKEHGLVQALLLGYRGDIDSDTYSAFRKTGLAHFISLSGMHLGILVGVIWWLCRTVGLDKPVRAIVCIIAIAIFLLIVPPRAPTLRAAIVCWVFCASFFFRRRQNSINTLSLAAIILLLIRPTGLFEVGWQLSFASVLGILLFCDRIYFLLHEKITSLSWGKKAPKTRPFSRIIARPGTYLLGLFSTGLAAWLGGAGILLYHFYTINPFTIIWTVVTFPFVAVILTTGFLKIIFALLLPTVATGLGIIVSGASCLLISFVKFFAHMDISQILIGHVSPAPVILYYGFILFAAFSSFRRPLIKKAICTFIVLALITFLGTVKWQRTRHTSLILTALDVGHGQAILAQLPPKTNVLFDAGSLYNSDIGRRTVTAFLNYNGINKIDCIIISHNDIDHINGIPEIIENCKVESVYANSAFFEEADSWQMTGFLKKWLNENGFKVKPLEGRLNITSQAKITFLWSTGQAFQNENLSDNDKSLVSLIEFAGRKILLCSDIEKSAHNCLKTTRL